jgi:DNA (cytosine-5)-methyltransferase 1
LANTNGKQCDERLQPFPGGSPERVGSDCGNSGMGNSNDAGSQVNGGFDELHLRVADGENPHGHGVHPSLHSWGNAVWIPFGDGKQRRVEPSISCMANGVPARVVRLRGYGNAIVPQVAAAFIQAYLDCQD